jgi:hypothetical protein
LKEVDWAPEPKATYEPDTANHKMGEAILERKKVDFNSTDEKGIIMRSLQRQTRWQAFIFIFIFNQQTFKEVNVNSRINKYDVLFA